ncbi:hypothetical protein OsI_18969 [Oryza sativa Indica Group]|uniref:DUF4216 domain-containing protein n=1 Tax=Oryza sativa subsp. indica TaxID=39946 RepID=A2Y1T5_ORYSI|nr:hypothetical protein OsI_18969 [Oryza sativa Indica Group]
MSLLIPGPTSPGKDFDLFLEPLIEELLELWIGVSTYDAFSARKFNLRAAVLWCIHDYPALSTLSGRTTKGYYACIHCDKNPLSRAPRNKIGYFGHRRFLPRTHAWRRSHAFDGHHENQVEPGKFSTDEVLEQLEKVKDVRPGSTRIQYMEDEIMDKLVWYVLNNCEEVQPYLEEELEKEDALDVDARLEKGFARWFKTHIWKLRKENPGVVSEALFALSCGPDLRVKSCASCIVNGVRYSTVDREKYLQTQNSGVMVDGTHEGDNIEFYGVLREILDLQYNSDLDIYRSVVLFRCDWFNQVGKTRGVRDDGHFKSINIQSFWYKDDPFILATQSKKIFYLQDTSLGNKWRIVQKFEHRNMYNVSEKDDHIFDVHQDDNCSDTEHEVHEATVVAHIQEASSISTRSLLLDHGQHQVLFTSSAGSIGLGDAAPGPAATAAMRSESETGCGRRCGDAAAALHRQQMARRRKNVSGGRRARTRSSTPSWRSPAHASAGSCASC